MSGMRYAVFGDEIYYPSGGFNDLLGVFGSLEDAETFARAYEKDEWGGVRWWHIVDLTTLEIVVRSSETAHGGGPDSVRGPKIFVKDGVTYSLVWDDEEYELRPQKVSAPDFGFIKKRQ